MYKKCTRCEVLFCTCTTIIVQWFGAEIVHVQKKEQLLNVQFLKSNVHFSKPQKWDVIRGLDAPIKGEDPRKYRPAVLFGVTGAHWTKADCQVSLYHFCCQ